MERRRMSEFDRQHLKPCGIPSQTQLACESTRWNRTQNMALERALPGYHMMKKDHVFIQFSHDVEVAAAELHRRRMPPPPVPINNGTTWTEEEHRYGSGDWRNISTHFVASRTPTQNVVMHVPGYTTDSGQVQLPTNPDYVEVPAAAEVHRRMPPPPVKKGTKWTEEEHRLFLDGLQIYGKGDWNSISRYCVVSRTPTQVASHSQKFFIRQEAPKNERKRKSIHDITIGNYQSNQNQNLLPPLPNNHNWVPLPDVATQQLQELKQVEEMLHPNPPNNSPQAGPSNPPNNSHY